MGNAHEYLMPDYYPDFHCKTGMCRAACCVGWNVSLSMQDYFRLLGVECRKHVREKLDCALHVKRYPTEDSYAELVHRYDGNCPLRMENGLCAIHAERARSFELALRNRLNACAEYLAQVSTRVHRQDHHAKREGRHLDACKWKSEERDIDL